NFAWTLTPMGDATRTGGYTFTHAHNLLLQLAVELGIPLAAVCLALVATAFFCSCWRTRQHPQACPKVALAMGAVVLWHSMLEFPLWYAHFLLPTVALLGFACAAGGAQTQNKPRCRGTRSVVSVPAFGVLVSLWAVIAVWQYGPVSDFFHPPNDGLSDAERMERSRESWLFGHFVDRYNATLYKSSDGRALQSLQVIKFEMLDVRLLQAWADAEWENGHEHRALFVAARTREFNTLSVRRWFERCEQVGDYFCSGRDLNSIDNMTFRDLR
ncbi:MAG TPA: Wzy polymerase domain-containing protein, partial [Rubrivivax sp.]|nr:Wzy polymerase domain-containing protein [Rubrivivax sp.]